MATSDPKRQLKIKTGVVKRLAKEKKSYEKEALQQEEKVCVVTRLVSYISGRNFCCVS